MEKGLCAECGVLPRQDSKRRCEQCDQRYQAHWKLHYKASQRRAYLELKMLVFDGYGGPMCACCGESEILFLSIDHINEDGAEHRRKLGKRYGWSGFYSWLKQNNFPTGFQVLCHNCNIAKHRNGGICPHKTQLRELLKAGRLRVSSTDMEASS